MFVFFKRKDFFSISLSFFVFFIRKEFFFFFVFFKKIRSSYSYFFLLFVFSKEKNFFFIFLFSVCFFFVFSLRRHTSCLICSLVDFSIWIHCWSFCFWSASSWKTNQKRNRKKKKNQEKKTKRREKKPKANFCKFKTLKKAKKKKFWKKKILGEHKKQKKENKRTRELSNFRKKKSCHLLLQKGKLWIKHKKDFCLKFLHLDWKFEVPIRANKMEDLIFAIQKQFDQLDWVGSGLKIDWVENRNEIKERIRQKNKELVRRNSERNLGYLHFWS